MSTSIDLSTLFSDLDIDPPLPHIALQTDLLAVAPDHLRPHLPPPPWLLVADPTTWASAGQALDRSLQAADIQTRRHLVQPAADTAVPIADSHQVQQVQQALPQANAALAVGAGTVNDIVKAACHRAGKPYAVCATAPSMNGYTSAIVALLEDGVKTTQPSTPPVAFLGDLDILAAAPYQLIAAGFGDLLSKPVSSADWRLSHRLLGTPYSTKAMHLVERAATFLDGVPHRLPQRQPDAIAHLTASLLLSGQAMVAAGSSAPASGGEHLLSHYLDMTHYALGTPHHYHGCQVGVATAFTAALYERLLALDLAAIDIDALVASHPTWPAQKAALTAHFGPLSPAVLPYAQQKHPSLAALRQRLTIVKNQGPALQAHLAENLQPATEILTLLRQAKAITTIADLGVSAPHFRAAALWSRHIRPRYTILDLAAELNLLEPWTDEALTHLT